MNTLSVKVTEDIYYIGVNDRETNLFENMWPLDNGVTYNSYLIKDEKSVLMDTVKINKVDLFIEKMEENISKYQNQYTLITNITKIDSFNQYKSLIFENSYALNNSFLFMWNDISSIYRNQNFEYEDDILKIQAQYFDDGEKSIKIFKKK